MAGSDQKKLSMGYRQSKWKYMGIRIGIVLALAIICLDTVQSFIEAPSATVTLDQQEVFIQRLERMHITHIYSGYWVCDRLIFESQEHIICSVLDENMKPGLTRYSQYSNIVRDDPKVAYVFTTNSDFRPQKSINALEKNTSYQKFSMPGYVVFYPNHKVVQ